MKPEVNGRGGGRPRGVQQLLEVTGTELLSPHMVRVNFGGEGVRSFIDAADPDKLATADKYVKLLFANPALGLTPPYDLEQLRERLTPDEMPVRRTYTVRSVDAMAGTLAIDFVVHGDEGIAGPWAAAAEPGDILVLSGPGGGYTPSQDADLARLILGDDSALPAIAAVLEAMPPDAPGIALLEVEGAADELQLAHPDGIELRWLHRAGAVPGSVLTAATRELPAPIGAIEVFAHGERAAMKELRVILSDDWKIERPSLSLSAYWASGRSEDRFQAEKREPVGAIFES